MMKKLPLILLSAALLTAATAMAAKTYKNTTEIPSGITTPDTVQTSIGELHFFDGVPTQETARITQDFLDRARGADAFLKGIPGASLQELRKGPAALGVDANGKVAIFDKLMDSHALFLTANTSTLYIFPYINTKEAGGALVVEVPPGMLGAFNDAWFRFAGDVGLAGPDKGKGGKYLVLSPDYEGDIPAGYHVIKSKTYSLWLFMRGNVSKGIDVAVKNITDHLKIYPLSQKDKPKPCEYISMSGKYFNTIHPNDFQFFEHLNHLIQEESDQMLDPETRGLFASIGIEKGKEFAPDSRMKEILTDAVAIANGAARANNYYPRREMKMVYFYKDKPTEWVMAYPDKNVFYNYNGAFNTDARAFFHYTYTAVTPAMATPHEGKGSDYCIAFKDSEHKAFDGSKTYKIHIPPKVPVNDFWALTIYDTQTRSMLQTDQPFPTVGSQDKGFVQNDDGSYDVYFAPVAPEGFEHNWLQTIPGKSWFVILRMYGPLKPFLDKTWRASEIEEVK
jgi:hypothetical protein